MKNIKLSFFAHLILMFGLVFLGCDDDDEAVDSMVAFTEVVKTIDTDNLNDVTFILSIEPAASKASAITIFYTATGGNAGTAFTTTPASSNNQFVIPVDKDATSASFIVSPIEDGIEFDDIEIDFEILSVGEGLDSDPLAGLYSSLTIENKKEKGSGLPFFEEFSNCEEGGSGELPEGWVEIVVEQNSLGTAHWQCSGYPAAGLAINPFNDDGTEGDGSEIWLVSPRIELFEATNPHITFKFDRRFETADFQEYDMKISADYDGTNFESASWEVFDAGVTAIEANDPGIDDYTSTGVLDLSDYAGQVISIAFIYYAEGSKFTATILRITEVLVEEQ